MLGTLLCLAWLDTEVAICFSVVLCLCVHECKVLFGVHLHVHDQSVHVEHVYLSKFVLYSRRPYEIILVFVLMLHKNLSIMFV